jgi:hypothetical protein
MERATGFEPVSPAWQAEILPLDDARMMWSFERDLNSHRTGTSRVHYPLCYRSMAGQLGIEPSSTSGLEPDRCAQHHWPVSLSVHLSKREEGREALARPALGRKPLVWACFLRGRACYRTTGSGPGGRWTRAWRGDRTRRGADTRRPRWSFRPSSDATAFAPRASCCEQDKEERGELSSTALSRQVLQPF